MHSCAITYRLNTRYITSIERFNANCYDHNNIYIKSICKKTAYCIQIHFVTIHIYLFKYASVHQHNILLKKRQNNFI